MSSAEEIELQQYEYQLTEIDRSLKANPADADLLELKGEITNLVNLLREALGKSSKPAPSAQASTSAPVASTSSAKPAAGGSKDTSRSGTPSTSAPSARKDAPEQQFTTGMDVLARWHKDNKFYPARIASVSGSSSVDPVYTVIFTIDKSTEVVRSGDVKALNDSKKRALQDAEKEEKVAAKVAKGEKKEKKEDDRKARVAAQVQSQSTWQNFAKKGAKKRLPGMTGESQFKTPDNPYGKVGVVGSGKGMTSYEQKKRTKFLEE